MSDGQIVALVAAILTFLGGIFGTYRLMRSDRLNASSTQAASLLAGYNAIVTDLQNEVARVKKGCQEEIEELKKEHRAEIEQIKKDRNDDRKRWHEERNAWFLEREHLHDEIEELKAQVYALMESNKRPRNARTRKSDEDK